MELRSIDGFRFRISRSREKRGMGKGLDTLTCVVPPEIEKRFAKRLKQIGMLRDREWPKWSFDLNEYVPKSNYARINSEIGDDGE